MDTFETIFQFIDSGADAAVVCGVYIVWKLDKRVAALENMLSNGIMDRLKRMEKRLDHHIDSES